MNKPCIKSIYMTSSTFGVDVHTNRWKHKRRMWDFHKIRGTWQTCHFESSISATRLEINIAFLICQIKKLTVFHIWRRIWQNTKEKYSFFSSFYQTVFKHTWNQIMFNKENKNSHSNDVHSNGGWSVLYTLYICLFKYTCTSIFRQNFLLVMFIQKY